MSSSEAFPLYPTDPTSSGHNTTSHIWIPTFELLDFEVYFYLLGEPLYLVSLITQRSRLRRIFPNFYASTFKEV